MRWIILTLLVFCIFGVAYAKRISAPPVLNQIPVAEQQYLQTLYDQWNLLECVTDNPDGTRTGKHGEIIELETGGKYYLEICVSSPSGTVWMGVEMTNLP
jgi:hypothetical protein